MAPGRILVATLCIAALAGGAIWFLQGPHEERATPLDGTEESRDEGEPLIPRPATENATNHLDLPDTTSETEAARTDESRTGLEVLIRAASGEALEAATVTWGATRASGGSLPLALTPEGLLELASLQELARTGADGIAHFSEVPAWSRPDDTILWASHPDLGTAFHSMSAWDASEDARRAELTLEFFGTLRVQVVDSDGDAVDGAQVLQVGLSTEALRDLDYRHPWLHGSAPSDDDVRSAMSSYIRVDESDRTGQLYLAHTPGPVQLVAVDGDKISAPVVTRLDVAEVTLVIQPRLMASGVIRVETNQELPADAQVECWWAFEGKTERLGRSTNAAGDGEWTLDLPRRKTGKYHFRLLGGELVPEEQAFEADSIGESLTVDLTATFGAAQVLRVRDPGGEPVEGARVEIIWQAGNEWRRSRAWTDDEGLASAHGCPDTACWVRGSKPGYVETTIGNIYVTLPFEQELTLPRAGSVRGRVVHDGEPAPSFQLYTWSTSPTAVQRHEIAPNDEGRFELDTVELGSLSLLATSPDHPESPVVTIEVGADETPEVVLELGDGTRGVGTVVDALSGDPLPNASLRIIDQFSGATLGERSRELPVAEDGSFEIEGLNPETPYIKVAAPNRVAVKASGYDNGAGVIQFGQIALAERQSLEVQLISDEPLNVSRVWFATLGEYPVSDVMFDKDGHCRAENVAPGYHHAQLVFYDGSSVGFYVELRPGEDWSIDFPYAPDATLPVQAVAADGEALPEGIYATCNFIGPDEVSISRAVFLDESGAGLLTHIPDGPAVVTIMQQPSASRIGSVRVDVGANREDPVEVVLAGRSLTLEALDPSGAPLDQGYVMIDAKGLENLWADKGYLESNGALTIEGLPFDDLLVTVRHQTLGFGFADVQLEPEGPTTVQVTVGDGSQMNLRVTDQLGPVAGVGLKLIPGGVATLGFPGKTDANGAWTYPGLPARSYTLQLDRVGYWPVEHEVEFTGQSPVELAVRRRGRLEVRVQSAEGAPLAGATLALRSLEYDTDVAEWLAAGKLAASATQLTGDGAGRCFALGLPCGPYAWSVTTPSGASASGELTVVEEPSAPLPLVVGS